MKFNWNKAFSDYETGFAFYGLGQLRNGSDSAGPKYGKKWERFETLGVYLDMGKGTLGFSLGGEYLGQAFQSEGLKKGPIYPAVAILNVGGCKIEAKRIPKCFKI